MQSLRGTPYVQNARYVSITEAGDDGAIIDLQLDVVIVAVPVTSLKLPPNPQPGKEIRILAIVADTNLDGNGHAILGGGATVPKGTGLDLTFGDDVWTPSSAAQALNVKTNCRLLLTAAIPLVGLPIIDGVQSAVGDRILRNVGNTVPNGIYVAAAGPWARAADMSAGSSAEDVFTFISQGTTFADTGWLCTTDRPNDVVGTDPITFVQFSTFPLATTPPVNVDKSAAQIGVSSSAARADHKHDASTAAAVALTVGGANAEGAATTLARSDHTHALAAPAAPVNVSKTAAAAGASANAARADHKHDIDTAVPVTVGAVNAEGVSTSLARADHVHAAGAAATNKYLQKAANTRFLNFTTTASGFDPALLSVGPFTPVAGTDVNYEGYVSFQANDVAPTLVNVHARIRDSVAGTVAVGSMTLLTPAKGTIALVGERVIQAGARTLTLEIGVSGSATCSVDVKASTPDTDFQGATLIVENVLP